MSTGCLESWDCPARAARCQTYLVHTALASKYGVPFSDQISIARGHGVQLIICTGWTLWQSSQSSVAETKPMITELECWTCSWTMSVSINARVVARASPTRSTFPGPTDIRGVCLLCHHRQRRSGHMIVLILTDPIYPF